MKFHINSRVLQQLGEELITTDDVAFTELIKNSYDAHAKKVRIHFISDPSILRNTENKMLKPVNSKILAYLMQHSNNKSLIVIEDNGDGMNLKTLQNGFFTIGTDYKKQIKSKINQDDRVILGEKGLGRLGAQRLSHTICVETTNIQDSNILFTSINWDVFFNSNKSLMDIDIPSFSYPKKDKTSYTRLWLLDLKSSFDKFLREEIVKNNNKTEQIELYLVQELQSAISYLYSPFESNIANFDIEIYADGKKVNSSFHNEVFNIAETEHSFKLLSNNNLLNLEICMKLQPWYIERVHQMVVGKDSFKEWRQEPKHYKELLLKYRERFSTSLFISNSLKELMESDNLEPLRNLVPLEGKVYSFKRDRQLAKMAIDSAKDLNIINNSFSVDKVTKFLEFHNGVKLYRNTFRIATLGDKDTDWLQLQQSRTKGQQFYRFDLGNIAGYVKVNDPFQQYIKEVSSRIDLSQNKHSIALKYFVKDLFNRLFYDLNRSASYLVREILKEENLVPVDITQELKDKIDDSNQIVNEAKNSLKVWKESIRSFQKTLRLNPNQPAEKTLNALNKILMAGEEIDSNIDKTVEVFSKSKDLLKKLESQQKNIAIESYNNYKLMANGLITEVITHEMHSLFSNISKTAAHEDDFKQIKRFLFNQKEYKFYQNHVYPILNDFSFVYSRMNELREFYQFLETTFLYKGSGEDFSLVNVKEFLKTLEQRFIKRLKKHRVQLNYDDTNLNWTVPHGALVHVFYNLIDNSLYWIEERRNKAKLDKRFIVRNPDQIVIKKIDDNTIHFFDSGTGVLPNFQYTLFHPLVSGKQKQGRGMGLYIVRELLRSFSADIELLSTENMFGNRNVFAITLQDNVKEIL